MAKTRMLATSLTGLVAINTDLFAADINVDSGGRTPTMIKVILHVAEAVNILVAYNGTTFVQAGVTLVNSVFELNLPVDTADTLQFQTDTVGGVTIRKGKVIAIFDDVL